MKEHGELRVIVNADDLGMFTEVNQETFGLMRSAQLTSASLVANGGAIADALRRVPEFPGCSFGVHLNGTTDSPLTDPGRLGRLVNETGRFNGALRMVAPDAAELEAIEAEFAAQIEFLVAHGVRPSHIDSHHHVHLLPGLRGVLRRIRERFGITAVRIYASIYPLGARLGWAKSLGKRVLNRTRFPAGLNLRRVDASTDLRVFLERVNAGWQPDMRTVELMVHPGARGERYVRETVALRTDWMRRVHRPVRLISYHEL